MKLTDAVMKPVRYTLDALAYFLIVIGVCATIAGFVFVESLRLAATNAWKQKELLENK